MLFHLSEHDMKDCDEVKSKSVDTVWPSMAAPCYCNQPIRHVVTHGHEQKTFRNGHWLKFIPLMTIRFGC